MVLNKNEKVQNKLYSVIIDEIDSILIDESRTPLIISGPSKINNTQLIKNFNTITKEILFEIKNNIINYFNINLKHKDIEIKDKGFSILEKKLLERNFIKNKNDLYHKNNIIYIDFFLKSLQAHLLFFNNKEYIIKNNEIIIVNENTGRMMTGRRWSEGLHQAIEAKENICISSENINLASITLQNFFLNYNFLAGMTGTAFSEREEFKKIYNLDVIKIPTNKKMIRKDLNDIIFLTKEDKYHAIAKDVLNRKKKKQPILIGTISIKSSEELSCILKKYRIQHNILNAKNHFLESDIIKKAGDLGAITIVTNIAGRGTDILLGSNNSEKKKEVISLGGLHIIGSERHELRRIDNQLIGRGGRQGDPGSSQFYISLEDRLIKLFAPKNIINIMNTIGLKKGDFIDNKLIKKIIFNAQKKIEIISFDIRKQLLEFDNIYELQRKIIYQLRNFFLNIKNITALKKYILSILEEFINILFKKYNFKKNKIIFLEKIKKNLNIVLQDEKYELIKNRIYIICKEKIISNIQIIGTFYKENCYLILINMLDNLWRNQLSLNDNLKKECLSL